MGEVTGVWLKGKSATFAVCFNVLVPEEDFFLAGGFSAAIGLETLSETGLAALFFLYFY